MKKKKFIAPKPMLTAVKSGVALKEPKSFVRRSIYQALTERYRKLSADMRIITKEGMSAEKIFLIAKYREQYNRGDKFVMDLYKTINQLKQIKK